VLAGLWIAIGWALPFTLIGGYASNRKCPRAAVKV
jgi:hypothetical protein